MKLPTLTVYYFNCDIQDDYIVFYECSKLIISHFYKFFFITSKTGLFVKSETIFVGLFIHVF